MEKYGRIHVDLDETKNVYLTFTYVLSWKM